MRIVHASNFSIKYKGANYYSIPYKLSHALTRLGHMVIDYADRDVANGNLLRIRELGKSRANKFLLDLCREVKPDLLLLGHCTIISPKTISAIKAAKPDMHIAHWNCDGLFVPENLARLRSLAPIVDATFVTTAGQSLQQIVQNGGRACFMPNPIDPSVETLKVFESNVPDDLVFLTGFNHYDHEKLEICDAIRTRLPDVKFDVRGLYGIPVVFGAEHFDVLSRAKMGLNVSKRNDVYLYSSDRMAHLMGCGLLTLVDKRTGFGDIFSDDELVLYADVDDLIAKIDLFRNNDAERIRIAKRGWQRAHEDFNSLKVAQWILDVTFQTESKHKYAWPTEIIEAPL